MCQKLCQMLANDVPMTAPVGLSLPSAIHDLACQAATTCSPGDKICPTEFDLLWFMSYLAPKYYPLQLDIAVSREEVPRISILQRDDYDPFSMGIIKTLPNSYDVISDRDDVHFCRTVKFLAPPPYLVLFSSQAQEILWLAFLRVMWKPFCFVAFLRILNHDY